MRRLRITKIDTPEFYAKQIPERMKINPFFDSVRQQALIEKVKNGDRVLDLGAGVFGSAQFIAAQTDLKCDLHAVDYSYTAREIVLKDYPLINYILSEATKTPYLDSYFDVVIAGELIEHIENPFDLVKEMARVCKKYGWLAISTLNTKCKDAQKRQYPEHLWEFEPVDLINLFSLFGKPIYKLVGNYHVIHMQNLKPEDSHNINHI